ncbi:hypothetical protein A6R68_15118 [Neotoma lepida]|uniref:Protein-cysteine N-palmitoyltransferase HHAT n=1 Tax=Neotoma lepida TaxID=56216 RepID=A0A1A6H9R1_NEOLE|nr:hypothetical protein A6R68_15118 [Neotoma lepida]
MGTSPGDPGVEYFPGLRQLEQSSQAFKEASLSRLSTLHWEPVAPAMLPRWELALCLLASLGFHFYSFYEVYKVSREHEDELDQEFELESDSLFGGLKKDPTDFEWNFWLELGKRSLVWLFLGHVAVSQLATLLAKKHRPWIVMVYGMWACWCVLGAPGVAMVFLHTTIAFCVAQFRSMLLSWLCSLLLLSTLRLQSMEEVKRRWYKTENEYYLLQFTLTVRCLFYTSFSLELCRQPPPAQRAPYSFLWLLAYMQQPELRSPKQSLCLLAKGLGRLLCWWWLAELMVHLMYMHALYSTIPLLESVSCWTLDFGVEPPKPQPLTETAHVSTWATRAVEEVRLPGRVRVVPARRQRLRANPVTSGPIPVAQLHLRGGLALAQVLFFYVKYLVLFGAPALLMRLDGLTPPPLPRCVSTMFSFTGMWRARCQQPAVSLESELCVIEQVTLAIGGEERKSGKPAAPAGFSGLDAVRAPGRWSREGETRLILLHGEVTVIALLDRNGSCDLLSYHPPSLFLTDSCNLAHVDKSSLAPKQPRTVVFSRPQARASFRIAVWLQAEYHEGQWYVYIPLGGSQHGLLGTLLSTAMTFAFVSYWHGSYEDLWCWAALNWLGVTVESGAQRLLEMPCIRETLMLSWPPSRLSSSVDSQGAELSILQLCSSSCPHLTRYLSPQARRRLHALLASCSTSMLILFNLVFLGGIQVGKIYWYRIFLQGTAYLLPMILDFQLPERVAPDPRKRELMELELLLPSGLTVCNKKFILPSPPHSGLRVEKPNKPLSDKARIICIDTWKTWVNKAGPSTCSWQTLGLGLSGSHGNPEKGFEDVDGREAPATLTPDPIHDRGLSACGQQALVWIPNTAVVEDRKAAVCTVFALQRALADPKVQLANQEWIDFSVDY